jgi:hypothetical protein
LTRDGFFEILGQPLNTLEGLPMRFRVTQGWVATWIGALALVAGTAFAQGARSDLAPAAPKAPHGPNAPAGVAPSNDNCATPVVITTTPFTQTVDTTGATTEPGEPASSCTLDGATVWYEFTYNGLFEGLISVDTVGSDFDTTLEGYTGACGALTSVACSDDGFGDGLQSGFTFVATPGTTYRFKAGGFDGDTGSLTFNLDVQGGACPPTVIDGLLGSGSPGYPGTSGNQLGRLNRNGISSTCAAPKTCNLFTPSDNRAFDSYVIPNVSGATQCVTVVLDVIDQEACNLQSNAYLTSFDPNNICTNYLADPGLSSGTPPTPTTFSFEIPADNDMVLVVHTTNPGEIGCNYTVTMVGDVCSPYVAPITQEIPALGKLGLATLALLLGAGALLLLRRRG